MLRTSNSEKRKDRASLHFREGNRKRGSCVFGPHKSPDDAGSAQGMLVVVVREGLSREGRPGKDGGGQDGETEAQSGCGEEVEAGRWEGGRVRPEYARKDRERRRLRPESSLRGKGHSRDPAGEGRKRRPRGGGGKRAPRSRPARSQRGFPGRRRGKAGRLRGSRRDEPSGTSGKEAAWKAMQGRVSGWRPRDVPGGRRVLRKTRESPKDPGGRKGISVPGIGKTLQKK